MAWVKVISPPPPPHLCWLPTPNTGWGNFDTGSIWECENCQKLWQYGFNKEGTPVWTDITPLPGPKVTVTPPSPKSKGG